LFIDLLFSGGSFKEAEHRGEYDVEKAARLRNDSPLKGTKHNDEDAMFFFYKKKNIDWY